MLNEYLCTKEETTLKQKQNVKNSSNGCT